MAERTLHEIIAGALSVRASSISDASSPDSLRRWDSLRHLELMQAVEDAYSVRFSAAEIVRARSVGDIRRLLEEKGVVSG